MRGVDIESVYIVFAGKICRFHLTALTKVYKLLENVIGGVSGVGLVVAPPAHPSAPPSGFYVYAR